MSGVGLLSRYVVGFMPVDLIICERACKHKKEK